MELNYDPLYPDSPVVDECLSKWSKHAAFYDKPAFKWINQTCTEVNLITYGQLDLASSAISWRLVHKEELTKSDRVILLYPPGLDFVSLIFGCQRAGVIAIPLMPPNANKQGILSLQEIILETKPVALIAPTLLLESLASTFIKDGIAENLRLILVDVPAVTAAYLDNRNNVSDSNISRVRSDDLYLIQYTSGSTGRPKATMVTAGAAAHNVRCARRAYNLHPQSMIASWLPQYHDCGLMFLLLTITCGATCVLASPFDFARRPFLWLEMISKFKATCTVVPGFALPLVAAKMPASNATPGNPLQLSQLDSLILVNEPILASDVSAFLTTFASHGLSSESIAPSYGLAENCTFVSTSWAPDNEVYPIRHGVLPCGKVPKDGSMDIRVVDPKTLKELPHGHEGEIWISSPSNAAGYLGSTSGSFKVSLAVSNSTLKFLRTGDTGVILKSGFLFVTGRLSDVVITEAGWIHPQHIERTAFRSSKHLRPGCCAAVQVAGQIVVVAEVVDNHGDLVTVAERMCMAVRREHRINLQMVTFVPPRQVPKTTSGKLRRSHAKHLLQGDAFHAIACVQLSAGPFAVSCL